MIFKAIDNKSSRNGRNELKHEPFHGLQVIPTENVKRTVSGADQIICPVFLQIP